MSRLIVLLPVKYLPSWLPGMGFKKIAENYKRTSVEVTEKPLAFVKHQIVSLEQLYIFDPDNIMLFTGGGQCATIFLCEPLVKRYL